MSTIAVDENIARIAKCLMDQQDRKLYGTVTVIYQAGNPERVEIKSGKKVSEL